MTDEYRRGAAAKHVDGTLIFNSKKDEANEQAIAELLAAAWGCEVRPFAKLSVLDFYAVREGRLVGVAELKSHPYESTKYPTTWLAVRKYMALVLADIALGVPGVFVARFADKSFWIPISQIYAKGAVMRGITGENEYKRRGDTEPIINVPIKNMRELGKHKTSEPAAEKEE
jgi:hypothetical protein